MSDNVMVPAGRTEHRVCVEPECNTVLSRYNEFDHCSLHQPMVVPRMRGKVL